MSLDIVIPTLNEEHFIGSLLSALEKQSFKDFTIFLSDGGSTDNTLRIARKFEKSIHLIIITNKKSGVSHQRNLGAKRGKAQYILFLDADTIPHPNFLTTFMKEVEAKHADIANSWIIPITERKTDKVLYTMWNILALEIGKYIWPTGIGQNLYVRRELFEELQGFDEKLSFWEDVDLVKRAVKSGRHFTVFRKPKIYTSTRRLELEGRISYAMENLKGFIYALRTGKIPNEKQMRYPMGLDYSILFKKTESSKRKLLKLLLEYKIYLELLQKIKSQSQKYIKKII